MEFEHATYLHNISIYKKLSFNDNELNELTNLYTH